MTRRKILASMAALLGVTVAASARPQSKSSGSVGLKTNNVEYGKKHYNGQGQLQDRVELIEKVLGLRSLD